MYRSVVDVELLLDMLDGAEIEVGPDSFVSALRAL